MTDPLSVVAGWPVKNAAAAVVDPTGVLAAHGDQHRPFPLASVTKPLAARAVQVAVEEGALELHTPAGPPGATVRHLLAHASGLSFDSDNVLAEPGTRRIYSNCGFGVVAEALERASGIAFPDYLDEAVFAPLGMTGSRLEGGAFAAGFGGTSTVADLAAFVGDLLRPRTVSAQLHAEASAVVFPGLDGVLPGFGVQRPNDWGLGFEIRGEKSPHWTGTLNSPRTYGHFGQSGTMIWVDPDIDLGLVVLADRPFGDWARVAWPPLTDAVIREYNNN